MRNKYATPQGDKFFKIVSEFGDKYVMTACVILSYMFMDLTKSFTISLNAYSALALLSILKSINHEARPFHLHDITPTKCPLEYGNPSGHSLLSSSLYLTFWNMACRSFNWKRGTFMHAFTFVLTIAGILLVAFSRIYHGVHTFNQIMNGFIWGVGLYMLYCDILYYHLCIFLHSINKKKWDYLLWNFGTKNFIIIYAMAIAMWIIGSIVHPMPE